MMTDEECRNTAAERILLRKSLMNQTADRATLKEKQLKKRKCRADTSGWSGSTL
jgi:hypothetical protein